MSYLNYSFNGDDVNKDNLQGNLQEEVVLEVIPRMTLVSEQVAHPEGGDDFAYTIFLAMDGGRSEETSRDFVCNKIVEGRDAISVTLENFHSGMDNDKYRFCVTFDMTMVARLCNGKVEQSRKELKYSVAMHEGAPLASFKEIKDEIVTTWHQVLQNAGFILSGDEMDLDADYFDYTSNLSDKFTSYETVEIPRRTLELTKPLAGVHETHRETYQVENKYDNEGFFANAPVRDWKTPQPNGKFAGLIKNRVVMGAGLLVLAGAAVAGGYALGGKSGSNEQASVSSYSQADTSAASAVNQLHENHPPANAAKSLATVENPQINSAAMTQSHVTQVQDMLAKMGVDINQPADLGCLVE